MSNLVTSKPYVDPARAANFKKQYGIDAAVTVTNVNDVDWNWVECTIRFQTKNNKKYVLTEYFKDGDDNSTDYVVLSYTQNNEKVERRFQRFVDAEEVMAYLMGLEDGDA